ncbi:MAG: VIT1/CCC1 transporter family protein [bacterium]|nr:VIT1/CCC1 transporter family protein [bacterium]
MTEEVGKEIIIPRSLLGTSQTSATHHFWRTHKFHPHKFTMAEMILGGQDGLVNVLGVTLGVAAVTVSSNVVLVVGLAAAFAESISLAAVAYTSKVAEADSYQAALRLERKRIEQFPEREREEISLLFQSYGFKGELLEKVVETLTSNKRAWLKVAMDEELEVEPVRRKDILGQGVWVGIFALLGSLLPLSPFFFLPIQVALFFSVVLAAVTLFAVGFYKAKTTLRKKFISEGLRMMMIGMLAAFTGYIIGLIFSLQSAVGLL